MQNALFKTHGQKVCDFFLSKESVNDNLQTFVKCEEMLDQLRSPANLCNHIQQSIELLGSLLLKENSFKQRSTKKIHACLEAFQNALDTGDESSLQGNPFYELTWLVYQHSLIRMENLFASLQYDLTSTPLEVTSHFWRHWEREGMHQKKSNLYPRIAERSAQWLLSIKAPMEILLFAVSCVLITLGVYSLLQFYHVFPIFSSFATGDSHGLVVSACVGFILSLAILDFKGRMLRGFAQQGAVLQGAVDAVLQNPCWMLIALCITIFSITIKLDVLSGLVSLEGDGAWWHPIIQMDIWQIPGKSGTLGVKKPDILINILLMGLAIVMDLWSVLLYGYWIARQGKCDKIHFPRLMKSLKNWEDRFITQSELFFSTLDVKHVFTGIRFPNETSIRYAFYKLLEEIDPMVQDQAAYGILEQFRQLASQWLIFIRNSDMEGYHARFRAINKLILGRKIYFPRFIEYLLPGIHLNATMHHNGFKGIIIDSEKGLVLMEQEFLHTLQMAVQKCEGRLVEQSGDDSVSRPDHNRIKVDYSEKFFRSYLFTCGTNLFQPPISRFSHTLYNWLAEVNILAASRKHEFDFQKDYFYDMKKILLNRLTHTLPLIRKHLTSITDICHRFPERCFKKGIGDVELLNRKLYEEERAVLKAFAMVESYFINNTYKYTKDFYLNDEKKIFILDDCDGCTQTDVEMDAFEKNGMTILLLAQSIEAEAIDEIKQLLSEITKTNNTTKQIIFDIYINYFKFQNNSNLNTSLHIIHKHNDMLTDMVTQTDRILHESNAIIHSTALHDEQNVRSLQALNTESKLIHEQIKNILNNS
ncbi:MAG: hypothetical protein H7839_01200 [Magnetococcus sp. YQC-5]